MSENESGAWRGRGRLHIHHAVRLFVHLVRRPRRPHRQGAPAGPRRERAPRGPETRWALASRGPARWAETWACRDALGSAVGQGTPGPSRGRECEAGGAGGPSGAGAGCGGAALPPVPACCPGTPGGGAWARSRRPRNKAFRQAATLARPGTLERNPWGSWEHPHRTGEGLHQQHLGEILLGAHSVRKSVVPTEEWVRSVSPYWAPLVLPWKYSDSERGGDWGRL